MSDTARPSLRGSTRQTPRRVIDRTAIRFAFLFPGALSLIVGLYVAVPLLGFRVPPLVDRLAGAHGPLMVFGFVGTLIVLERAVAVKRWWAFVSPAFLGVGSLLVLFPLPPAVGRTMIVLGAVGLLVIYRAIWHRQATTATAIQALGATGMLAAAILWLAELPVPHLVLGFTGFLVLTIAGERLELARVALTDPRAGRGLLAASLALTACIALALCWPVIGYPLFGATLIWLVAWLVINDVAMRTIRLSGLPRCMAGCLLSGYAWLVAAGGIWLVAGPVTSGAAYDAGLSRVSSGHYRSPARLSVRFFPFREQTSIRSGNPASSRGETTL